MSVGAEQNLVDQPSQPIAMLPVPVAVVMLVVNHLQYALKAGAFNQLGLNELKSVIDNASMLRDSLPEPLRAQLQA